MQPQHLAQLSSRAHPNEALASQVCRLPNVQYFFGTDCFMVRARNTQVSLTSETGRVRQFQNARPTHIDRRHRCQRASNSWQPSVSSPLLPHVHPARQKKSMSWSSPSPSRSNLRTQVSTSKRISGQAIAPVPTCPARAADAPSAPFDTKEGV